MLTLPASNFPYTQKGAALVVSMVMLLVITVIGIAVMGGSHLEWLMANNSHLQTDAYRNAEIALAQGLGTIANPPTAFPTLPTPSYQDLTDVTKWSDGTILSTTVPTATGSAAYFVEPVKCSQYTPPTPLSFVNNNCATATTTRVFAYIFRVWALGTDGKGAARILQSTRTVIANIVTHPYNGLPPIQASGQFPFLDNRVEMPQ